MSFRSRTLAVTGTALLVFAHDALAGCAPGWNAARVSAAPYLAPAALADYNGDGLDDIVAARTTDVSVFHTNPVTTSLGTFVSLMTGATGISSVATADFDGNGHKDVVIGSSTNPSLTIFRNNGDGTFASAATIATSVNPKEVVTADFNGDGNADLAARAEVISVDSDTALTVWIGDGHGAFTERSHIAIPSAVNVPLVGDWNKDGKRDILMLNLDGRSLTMFRGNGDGTFMPPTTTSLTFAARHYATGDFDGDGDLDVVLSDKNETGLTVLQNDGTGAFPSFDKHGTVPPTGTAGGDVSSIAAGDVTQDGIDDVLITQFSGSYVTTYVGVKNGKLEAPYFSRVHHQNGLLTAPARALLGRFNSDAKTDVMFLVYSNGAGIALNNCGETSLTASTTTPVITTGDAALLKLVIEGPNAIVIPKPPVPTGTFSIYEDTRLVGTLNTSDAQYELRGLSPGNHVLYAVYSGDERNDPARSTTFEIRVTDERTTTAISTTKAVYSFYEGFTVKAAATSADGAPLSGQFQFFVDGVLRSSTTVPQYIEADAGVGEHRYQVRYLGTEPGRPAFRRS